MSKQYSAKVMFDQAIVYLFNGYVQEGYTREQASLQVTKDIEEVFIKHKNRSGLVKNTNTIISPITKIEKVLKDLHPTGREDLTGKRPTEVQAYYEGILRNVSAELTQLKMTLEK